MKSRNTYQNTIHNEASNVGSTISGNTPQDGISLIQRGNEYFFSNCYLEATGYYYQAAMVLKHFKDHKTERSKAWSNVAECHLRLQNWQAAEDASTNALIADPTNSKALYRRAKARFELGDYVGAATDAENVGTRDAMDVAALCRDLACAHFAQKLATSTPVTGATKKSTRRDGRRLGIGDVERREPPPSPTPPTESVEDEREFWFRRIIDSYRLRIDDEYTQTGACDAGCLYGIRAKGLSTSPLDHSQAYVHRALKKRVVPAWFSFGDMDDLCRMATTDGFSNINVAVMPDDILTFYAHQRDDELQALRNLAVFIEGPIGMPWKAPTENRKIHSLKMVAPKLNPVEHHIASYDPATNMHSAGVVYPSIRQQVNGYLHPRQRPYDETDHRQSRKPLTPTTVKRTNNSAYPFYDRYYHPLPQSGQQPPPSSPKRNRDRSSGKAEQAAGWEHPSAAMPALHLEHQVFPRPRSADNRSLSPVPVSEGSLSTSTDLEGQSFALLTPYHHSSTVSKGASRPMGSGLRQQCSFYGKDGHGEFYSQEATSMSQHGRNRSRELRDECSELTEMTP